MSINSQVQSTVPNQNHYHKHSQTAVNFKARVSKTEFLDKVDELKAFISNNKPGEAQGKWDELHKILVAEFSVGEQKIEEATRANDQVEIERLSRIRNSKVILYSEIVVLHVNLADNKAALCEKLNSYANTLY